MVRKINDLLQFIHKTGHLISSKEVPPPYLFLFLCVAVCMHEIKENNFFIFYCPWVDITFFGMS